jgi:TP901 family phage tail tape measure protein
MELLEYLIQLRGAAATGAEVEGLTGKFRELAVAAKEAGDASAEGGAAAGAGGKDAETGGGAAMGAGMKKMAGTGIIALAALGVASVKMSNTFSTEMLKIRTEGGASSKEFTHMRAAVLQLASSGASMGAGPTSLAQGLYHLESMGLRGSKALLALKLSAEEAAISGSSLEDTTTAIGGAMFIAAKGTGTLNNLMSTLNAIAGSGNMRFQDLNEALGTGLLTSAKVAGVSLQETGAALAVLTDSGYHASSAAAQLGTALHYLYAPTTKAQAALATIHLSGNKLAADLHKPQGLLVALRDLKTHMSGLSEIQQEGILNDILPGGRGRVLLGLYKMQNRLAPKYGQIIGTAGVTAGHRVNPRLIDPAGGTGLEGFAKHVAEQQQNPQTRLLEGFAKIEASLIKLGDVLTKYVTPAAVGLEKGLAGMVVGITAAVSWFAKMSPLARAVGTFVLVLGGSILGLAAALKIAAIAQGIFDGVLALSPLGWALIAFAALAAGVVYAYTKFGGFRAVIKDVWSWIKSNWHLLAEILGGPIIGPALWIILHWGKVLAFMKKVPGAIVGFFKGLGHDIGRIFDGVVNIVIGAINTIIHLINGVIRDVDKLHVHVLGHNFGAPHIGQIGTIGRVGGNGAPTRSTAPRMLSRPGARVSSDGSGPTVVHGDIVVKVREREIGRVTKRQIEQAMMG